MNNSTIWISAVAGMMTLAGLLYFSRFGPSGSPVPARIAFAGERDDPGFWRLFEKPAEDELRKKLDPVQYRVTQESGTERPFSNEYWDNHEPGIYVDIVSGEPLFSSADKFDSGTGWPSFSRPIADENITEHEDHDLAMKRVEVRSKQADSHLGHLFDDGPAPTGQRYCINSAALEFIPVADLEGRGYGEYAALFDGEEADDPRAATEKSEVATLAGGCFWGMEDLLREIPGVVDTQVGYTGGTLENPTYKEVSGGSSGHAESIRIVFNPDEVSFETILRTFFRIHDPTTSNRQGNDRGTQYRSAIFYHDDEQRAVAEDVVREVGKSGFWKNPIVTEVTAAGPWYDAEGYHQDYLEKNPGGYTCHYFRD